MKHRSIAVDISSFCLTKHHEYTNVVPLLLNIKGMATIVHMHESVSLPFVFILSKEVFIIIKMTKGIRNKIKQWKQNRNKHKPKQIK